MSEHCIALQMVSPFIQLENRILDFLQRKNRNPKLAVQVLAQVLAVAALTKYHPSLPLLKQAENGKA